MADTSNLNNSSGQNPQAVGFGADGQSPNNSPWATDNQTTTGPVPPNPIPPTNSAPINNSIDSTVTTDNNQSLSSVSQPSAKTEDGQTSSTLEPPTTTNPITNLTLEPIGSSHGGAPVENSTPPPWISSPPPANPPPPAASPHPEPKPAKKSILGKILTLLVLLAVLAGLGWLGYKYLWPRLKPGGGPNTGQGATLIYWGLWEPTEAMTEVIADYEGSHPGVKIDYQQQSHKDYRERLQSAIANKKNDQAAGPDIFRFHNTWLPMMESYLAPMEVTTIPLDDYFPVIKNDLVKGNQLYGIPLMFDCLSLYYNTDLLEAAGQTVPTNWEELQKTAISLTALDENGRIQTSGVALGTANNVDHFSDILGLMLLQNNADLTKPVDELASDALTFYTLFATRDKVWDESLPSSAYAFANGKVAMIFAPSWRIFEIKTLNPNLHFKTAPVPQIPDNKVAWATYWAEGIAQTSKQTKEAQAFLTYLSQDEVLRKLYDSQAKVPGRGYGEVFPKSALAQDLASDPLIGSFVSQGEYAQSWYMSSRTHDNGLNDSIIQYYVNAINAMTQEGQEAAVALSTVSQGLSQVLGTYRVAVTR
jgi:multiple sugar transport system substrate-binding protein